MSPDLFDDKLAGLAVSSRRLREDPRGESWLPDAMKSAVRSDPECARRLQRHIEIELALFDDATSAPDALFTARVMAALPSAGLGQRDRRRWVLLPFYALAAIVAGILIHDVDGLGPAVVRLHGARDRLAALELWHGIGPGADLGVWLCTLGLVAAACLLLSTRGQSVLTPRS